MKTTSELQPCDAGIIQSYKTKFRQRQLRWMLRVLEEFESGTFDLEKIKPDVKQAIIWTREAWNVGVEQKTIVNCWRKTGILPRADVEVVEESRDVLSELAMLLTEFATDKIPDVMAAKDFLAIDGDIPTEAEEAACTTATEEESSESEDEEQPEHQPVSLKEARACMAKVAEFIQVNSASRNLARFVDISMEMQSELDKTVVTVSHTQAPMTRFFKPVPKITTISPK